MVPSAFSQAAFQVGQRISAYWSSGNAFVSGALDKAWRTCYSLRRITASIMNDLV